jgi:class 3 adenylate cyclase
MEPRIQYVKTSDGVSIAYWTMGDGPALLLMPPAPVGHIAGELALPELGIWYERLARTYKLIRYDPRGSGASDRDPVTESQEAYTLDVLAVLDSLDVSRVALCAVMAWVPVAISCTARRQENVSHLILWDGFARAADYQPPGRLLATRALIERDWRAYTDAWAHTAFGWEQAASARLWSRWFRDATTPERTLARIGVMNTYDVASLLPNITVPALIVDHREHRYVARSGPQFLAANLPNARLVTLDGHQAPPFWDPEQSARLIDEFTGLAAPKADIPASAAPPAGSLVTLLFTDITDSTAFTQRLGDAAAQELVRTHNAIVRQALAASGGSEIKHTGDGIMASFPTASGGLECAVAIQRGVALHGESDLAVHIGLNAGEPVAEESDLFGTSVQLARRICDHAQAGQIVASNVVRELAAGKGFRFSDIGEVVPKGFEEPVRLYEVRWRE